MKTLVLVEASGKTELLARRLREMRHTVQVLATVGHLCDNPKSLRPIALDPQLREMAYGLREDRAALFKKIADAAAMADQIILAMDDDQEGDVIAHDLATLLPDEQSKMRRVRLGSLGADELRAAFASAKAIDPAAAWPGMCRRIVDRAIGSAYTVIAEGATIPVGRVQSGMLDAVARSAPQIGTYRIPLQVSDGRTFMAEVPVSSDAGIEAMRRAEAALAAGAGKILGQEERERPASLPWSHEEAVEAIALRLHVDIDVAANALQEAYERGLVSYPRARAKAFTPDGVEIGARLAHYNRCAFAGDQVPSRPRTGAQGLPHEAPRPMEEEVLIGRTLNMLDAAESVQVLLARNLIQCGQTVRETRLRVAAADAELEFCYTARPPMRNWKDKAAKPGYEALPLDVALLRHMRIAGLGRASTLVKHVTTMLARNVVEQGGAGIRLTEKGEQWLAHARRAGLSADVSVAIEARLEKPMKDVHRTAREILREHGLLGQVDTMIAKHAPKRQEHAPGMALD
jgi:DNA topoisomerase-1